MNYTYLPSSQFSPHAPVIVMTTNPSSKKTNNLVENPNVSLLVHDCMFRPHVYSFGTVAALHAQLLCASPGGVTAVV